MSEGEGEAVAQELARKFGLATEAVDYPTLCRFQFLFQSDDFRETLNYVKYEGLAKAFAQ